jgi:CheY-like chemotaxis protein
MQNGNKRVLVIDDNPDMRRTMQALLESEGFDVAVAADGEEGLSLQRSMPAAVVNTDIYMPKMLKKPFAPEELIEAVRELIPSG